MSGLTSMLAAADGVSLAEVARLPVVVDLLTAARVLGVGRTTAYALARAGEFPCPVIRVGGGYRVPTVGLLRLLGVDAADRAGGTSGVAGGIDRATPVLGLPRALPAARA